MGAWGAKLYQDDVAQDVRDYFKDQLRRGKTAQELTEELIGEYSYLIDDADDGPVFWFALADTQWGLGRLLPKVKEEALLWLDKGGDVRRWEAEDPKQAVTRKKVLEDLHQKLLSPQPPEKKVSQYRLYTCEWDIGDVFAYRFNGEYAETNGFLGKFIYFIKVDERVWYPGHIIPIVYFYKKVDDVMATIDLLDAVDFIPQFFKPIAYQNDPNLKKEYILTLLNTSSRVIPKEQLTYLGNIKDIKRVDDEDLNPHSFSVTWKNFEVYMIRNLLAWL